MKSIIIAIIIFASITIIAMGCNNNGATANTSEPCGLEKAMSGKGDAISPPCKMDKAAETDGKTAPIATGENAGEADVSVSKIVFIDKEKACPCTAERIAASWTALESALGKESKIAIERIHIDTQSAQAAPYQAMKSMVTVPGIYFLGKDGKVIKMLQGEVKVEQIATVLGKAK